MYTVYLSGTQRVNTPPFLYRDAGKSARPLSVNRPSEIFGLASTRVFRQVMLPFCFAKSASMNAANKFQIVLC